MGFSKLRPGLTFDDQWAAVDSIKTACTAAEVLQYNGAALWVSRAKSGAALQRMAKTKEAWEILKRVAGECPALGETGCCTRAGKLWQVSSLTTVATLDKNSGAIAWNMEFLTTLGIQPRRMDDLCVEVRRERQFL